MAKGGAIMQTVTQFAVDVIGVRHPDRPLTRDGQIRIGTHATCWLCGGQSGDAAWRLEDAIAPTFTNFNTARAQDSDTVCADCVALTRAEAWQELVARRRMPLKTWAQAGWQTAHDIQIVYQRRRRGFRGPD